MRRRKFVLKAIRETLLRNFFTVVSTCITRFRKLNVQRVFTEPQQSLPRKLEAYNFGLAALFSGISSKFLSCSKILINIVFRVLYLIVVNQNSPLETLTFRLHTIMVKALIYKCRVPRFETTT